MQKRARMRRFFMRFSILFTLGGGSILFLLLSPRFQFESILLSGNTTVSAEEITNAADAFLSRKIAWFFSRRNVFLFRPDFLEAYILKEFPQISTTDVSRSFSRKIALHVSERAPWGLYCKFIEHDCFYIAEDGVLAAEAPQLTGNAVFRLVDRRTASAFFMLGDRVIEESDAVFLRDMASLLKDRFKVTVREVVFGRVFQGQAEFITNEGWYVLFDERTNKERALENLALVLNQHITDRSAIEYIDIRFEDKVFYKNK